jgi:hypothetical protein
MPRCVVSLFVVFVLVSCATTAEARSRPFNTQPPDPPGTVRIDGLPCNIPCQQYIAWSRSILQSFERHSSYRVVRTPAKAPRIAARHLTTRHAWAATARPHRVAIWRRPIHSFPNAIQSARAAKDGDGIRRTASRALRSSRPLTASPALPDRRASRLAPTATPPRQDPDKTVAHREPTVTPRITADSRSLQPKDFDANTASTTSPDLTGSIAVRHSPGPTTDRPSDINADLPRSAAELPRDPASPSQDKPADGKDAGSTSASTPQSSVMADRQPPSKPVDEPTDHPPEGTAAEAQPKADDMSTQDSRVTPSPDLSPARSDAKVADAKPTDAPSAPPTTGSTARAASPAIEKQIEAATALAQKLTLADHSGDQQTDKTADDATGKIPPMIALVLARTELKSMSDLAGKVVAVDERRGASDRGVRPALVAAGASDIQMRESGDDAVAQLVEGQVPAAVLALASQDAADAFPAIAGFRLFQLPLSEARAHDSAEPK